MLDEIVEKICDENADTNSREFYTNSIQCCIECAFLLPDFLLMQDEKKVLEKAKTIWFETSEYNIMSNLLISFSGRYGLKENSDKRNNALRILMGVLIPFENWTEEHERPYALDYCYFYLKNAGIADEKLTPIIKKYFKKYF